MSDFTNIAIILLAGLTQATLQLSFGALILLFHSSIGKHRRRKTSHLARSYIIGTGAISFLSVAALAFILSVLFNGNFDAKSALMVLVGILLVSSIVMWRFYFRKGSRTELWLPRSFAKFIGKRARETDDVIEAFSLGILSSFAEVPISLSLYIVAAYGVLSLTGYWQIFGLLLYTALAIMPLAIMKLRIRTGSNVVEVQRWRVQNKAFLKHFSGWGFITLAAVVLSFWVI
jgi:hypothetical protein